MGTRICGSLFFETEWAHSVALYTSWTIFKLNARWTTDRIFKIRYTSTLGVQLKYDSYVRRGVLLEQKACQAPIE